MYILTIHGLHGSSTSHYFMKKYIEAYYKPTTNERLVVASFDYNSYDKFDDILCNINKMIDNFEYNNENEKCILIGHSLGGVISVHITNPHVSSILTISSPINDCKLAKKVNDNFPTKVSSFLFGYMYEHLTMSPSVSHDNNTKIICVSSSTIPYFQFDGRVYVDEMVHPQAYKVFHLDYSDHIVQIFDIRMFRLIYDALIEFEKV